MTAARFAGLMYCLEKGDTMQDLAAHAYSNYTARYGKPPTVAHVHTDTVLTVDSMEVVNTQYILPGHILVGERT